jgi:hypothetical protein
MKKQAALLVAAVLLLPLSVGAASKWTAAGATGTIVSPSVALFSYPTGGVYSVPLAGGNGSGITYNFTTSTGGTQNDPFVVAYNVVSPDLQPAWTTLTITYSGVNSGSLITAIIYGVSSTTGARTAICSVSSLTTTTTQSCTFGSTTLNFGANAYYVEVTIDRSSTSQRPTLNYLSIN